jgi:hypothetical protein
MTPSYLPLTDMANRHRGLTQPIATSYLEAARVCLDRHHTSPTEFVVQNGTEAVGVLVEWEATDERSRGAWANHIDTTETGAYACALAAVDLTEGLVAIRRAETGTGADYYIGPPDQPLDDLEGRLRLEVSGTDRGTASAVARRLREKIEQAAVGNSNLPAMVGVVGFYAQLIMLQLVVAP